MYDFRQYNLKDLFRIRDCLSMLDEFGLADDEMYQEVKFEIDRRVDKNVTSK